MTEDLVPLFGTDGGMENIPNITLVEEEQEEMIRRITLYVVPVIFAIVLIIGLIGNTLVIGVVVANPQMKNTTNLLILNLAVADLLFVLVCVPFTATDYVLMYWPFGLFWCRSVQYLIYVTAYVSIYTLVLMAGDRFMAVVFPVTSLTLRTITNARLAIGGTWLAALLGVSPVWLAHNLISANTHSYCYYDRVNYSFKAFHISFFVTSFALPVCLIILMYIVMLSRLWRPTIRTSKEGLKAKRRVTALVLAVISSFVVCWAPIQTVLLHKAVVEDANWDSDFYMIVFQITSHVLAYTNSCLNPLLYAKMSNNFRRGFSQLVPLLFGELQRPSSLGYEMTSRRRGRNTRPAGEEPTRGETSRGQQILDNV